MTMLLAGILLLSGIALITLAVTIFVRPDMAERFLELFASSARAHWMEQLLRVVAGVSLWLYAPHMWMPRVFQVFGGIILVSAIVLLILPWRLHQRFARWAIPLVLRHLTLYALGALAIGCWVMAGVLVPMF